MEGHVDDLDRLKAAAGTSTGLVEHEGGGLERVRLEAFVAQPVVAHALVRGDGGGVDRDVGRRSAWTVSPDAARVAVPVTSVVPPMASLSAARSRQPLADAIAGLAAARDRPVADGGGRQVRAGAAALAPVPRLRPTRPPTAAQAARRCRRAGPGHRRHRRRRRRGRARTRTVATRFRVIRWGLRVGSDAHASISDGPSVPWIPESRLRVRPVSPRSP